MLGCILCLALLSGPVGQAATPSFSFHEPEGVGDPNPYFEDGIYSVFYLKNVGRHPWWMTQSSDLLTWSGPQEAVEVGAPGAPDVWTGSGSVIADPGGGYRLYYTGHSPQGRPKEVVMTARAGVLTGPWVKDTEITVAGLPDYDPLDFRDPFVFWNGDADEYWMLVTSRQTGRAVIGLYASSDLKTWSPRPALYAEESPLNLEVPDLFEEAGNWFLLYSDQREDSRQVRYLTADESDGPYAYGPYDALDGRAFYAGKSAGSGSDRRLFGWVAHKTAHEDQGAFVWGGDLVVHALRRTDAGALAVDVPSEIADAFVNLRSELDERSRNIGRVDKPLLVRADVTASVGARFGFRFQPDDSDSASTLEIDTSLGEAKFLSEGHDDDAARIRFPVKNGGEHHIELLLDPGRGVGVLYIDRFRALSFRFYDLSKSDASIFVNGESFQISGAVLER